MSFFPDQRQDDNIFGSAWAGMYHTENQPATAWERSGGESVHEPGTESSICSKELRALP